MISVAYRTSLKMFCDVKPHFSQLLKARVQDFDFHFSIEKVPSSKKNQTNKPKTKTKQKQKNKNILEYYMA